MARSKNPESYPPEIKQLLDATLNNPKGINISFETKAELMKQRALFYSFINALDKQEVDNAVIQSLCVSAEYRKIQLTYEDKTLRLLDKQFTPGIVAMRAALAALPTAPKPTDEETNRSAAIAAMTLDNSPTLPADAGYNKPKA